MNEHKTRNTVLLWLFMFIVILAGYFDDIISLMIPRYRAPYWSANTISAIMEIYNKAPCVSKVRFYDYGDGTSGIDAVCEMRWDASPQDAIQAYENLRIVISSEKFLSGFCKDFFSDDNIENASDLDTMVFSIQINSQGRNIFFGDAFYDLVVTEQGPEIVQNQQFPLFPTAWWDMITDERKIGKMRERSVI